MVAEDQRASRKDAERAQLSENEKPPLPRRGGGGKRSEPVGALAAIEQT